MAESRSDPGALNIVIQNLVKAAVESKEIEDTKEIVLFKNNEHKQALHCFIFKRVMQSVTEPDAKTVDTPQKKIIFAYVVKDASTKNNTASLYNLEEALPELIKLAEEHQAILYAPLALCRHAAKLKLSFAQLHHMVFLELNPLDKYLKVYDSLGPLSGINFSEGFNVWILRLGLAIYPNKLTDLKSTYQYRGWQMLDTQKHGHLCTKYVGASLESIIKVGDTSALKQIKILPEEVESQAKLFITVPPIDECVASADEADGQEYVDAITLQQKEHLGSSSPRMFSPVSPPKQAGVVNAALEQAVSKTSPLP